MNLVSKFSIFLLTDLSSILFRAPPKEHMTVEDIMLVNIFLESRVEKKYLNVEPFISLEAEKVGREYIIKKLQETSGLQK